MEGNWNFSANFVPTLTLHPVVYSMGYFELISLPRFPPPVVLGHNTIQFIPQFLMKKGELLRLCVGVCGGVTNKLKNPEYALILLTLEFIGIQVVVMLAIFEIFKHVIPRIYFNFHPSSFCTATNAERT